MKKRGGVVMIATFGRPQKSRKREEKTIEKKGNISE